MENFTSEIRNGKINKTEILNNKITAKEIDATNTILTIDDIARIAKEDHVPATQIIDKINSRMSFEFKDNGKIAANLIEPKDYEGNYKCAVSISNNKRAEVFIIDTANVSKIYTELCLTIRLH